jgi:hypothetical protein
MKPGDMLVANTKQCDRWVYAFPMGTTSKRLASYGSTCSLVATVIMRATDGYALAVVDGIVGYIYLQSWEKA